MTHGILGSPTRNRNGLGGRLERTRSAWELHRFDPHPSRLEAKGFQAGGFWYCSAYCAAKHGASEVERTSIPGKCAVCR